MERCNRYFWIFLYVLRLTFADPRREAQLRCFNMATTISLKSGPFKKGARIGLASRRDMFVPGDIGQRIASVQGCRQGCQHLILKIGEGRDIGPLQFYADREIIAALASVERGNARMPGAVVSRDKLDSPAIALNHEVRRYPQRPQLVKIRVGVAIELVAEQLADERSAKLARRQADIVDHQQVGDDAVGTGVKIRRRLPLDVRAPAVGADLQTCRRGAGIRRHVRKTPVSDVPRCRTRHPTRRQSIPTLENECRSDRIAPWSQPIPWVACACRKDCDGPWARRRRSPSWTSWCVGTRPRPRPRSPAK